MALLDMCTEYPKCPPRAACDLLAPADQVESMSAEIREAAKVAESTASAAAESAQAAAARGAEVQSLLGEPALSSSTWFQRFRNPLPARAAAACAGGL